MLKVPWAEPIEEALTPYQGIVTLALVIVLIVTLYMLVRGTALQRTAWLVWCMFP